MRGTEQNRKYRRLSLLSEEAVGGGSASGETYERKIGIPGSCGRQARALCVNVFRTGSESEPVAIGRKLALVLEQPCAFADDRETAGGFLNRPGALGACAREMSPPAAQQDL